MMGFIDNADLAHVSHFFKPGLPHTLVSLLKEKQGSLLALPLSPDLDGDGNLALPHTRAASGSSQSEPPPGPT